MGSRAGSPVVSQAELLEVAPVQHQAGERAKLTGAIPYPEMVQEALQQAQTGKIGVE